MSLGESGMGGDGDNFLIGVPLGEAEDPADVASGGIGGLLPLLGASYSEGKCHNPHKKTKTKKQKRIGLG